MDLYFLHSAVRLERIPEVLLGDVFAADDEQSGVGRGVVRVLTDLLHGA